jgi:hypothetical protein
MKPYIPSPQNPWDYAKAAHLLRRTVIGVCEADIRRAVREGFEATTERVFTTFAPDLAWTAEWVGTEPFTASPPAGPLYDLWYWDYIGRRTGFNQWWMKTMTAPVVSLQERMVMFWHGHFTSSYTSVLYAEWMHKQQSIFRKHVWGNFRTMVELISEDVGMLIYLNGFENQKTAHSEAINENFARELMELFTMGIVDKHGTQNYTQRDVREAARSLTGWKMKPGKPDHSSLESVFYPWYWDGGEKIFFGNTGKWKTRDIINIMFSERSEQIAWHICSKFYRYFVDATTDSTNATQNATSQRASVIDTMAATLLANKWEIQPVLHQLLTSETFFDPEVIGSLPKSGIEFMVGMLRTFAITGVPDFEHTATQAEHWRANDLLLRMETMGHLLFFPPNVGGWNDGRAWLTSSMLAARLKNATRLMLGTLRYRDMYDIRYNFDPLAFARQFPEPNKPRALVSAMATLLFCIPPSEDEITMLTAILLDGGADYEWSLTDPKQRPADRIRTCLAAMVSMPKMQLH